MKAYYSHPDGTYSVNLSIEELAELLSKGKVIIHMYRSRCTTGRAIFNKEKSDFEILDKKDVFNNVQFHTDEAVADIEGGNYGVQFLRINIDKQNNE